MSGQIIVWRRTSSLLIAAVLIAASAAPEAHAQAAGDAASATTLAQQSSPAAGQATDAEQSPQTFWQIVLAGGWTGFFIMLFILGLSVAAVALAAEHLTTIRESVLMPPGLADEVRGLLVSGDLAGADRACREQPSFLSFVLSAGLAEADGGWNAVEKGMEDATAEQAARLFRKIEYLSVIGNIAPMVGLLGTVTGMIFAFQEVANTQGAARAAQLAEGIYQALVTTVGGLLVAIPSLAGFAIFRNRVDHLVAETVYVAQQVVAPLKRARVMRRRAAAGAPPPVEGTH